LVTSRKTIGLTLILTAAARGGIVLELVPDRLGPYEPASSVDVDVLLRNEEGRVVQPRLITLDFSVTDPNLALPGTFHFDSRTLLGDFLYSRFETMPKVDFVYTSQTPSPGFILQVPDGGSLLLGTLAVGVPNGVGTYMLDAINANALDTNTGARVEEGFDRVYAFAPIFDNLTGGTLGITVVPEPAPLVLLALGGVAPIWIRRRY